MSRAFANGCMTVMYSAMKDNSLGLKTGSFKASHNSFNTVSAFVWIVFSLSTASNVEFHRVALRTISARPHFL
jgi:hypothetical protein